RSVEVRRRERGAGRLAVLVIAEEAWRQDDAVYRELLEEMRLQPCCAERREQSSAPGTRVVLLVRRTCDEDVLERDHIRLHPQHLGDVRDAAGAVAGTRGLGRQMERSRELVSNRAEGE